MFDFCCSFSFSLGFELSRPSRKQATMRLRPSAFRPSGSKVKAVSFHPVLPLLAVANEQGEIFVWDVDADAVRRCALKGVFFFIPTDASLFSLNLIDLDTSNEKKKKTTRSSTKTPSRPRTTAPPTTPSSSPSPRGPPEPTPRRACGPRRRRAGPPPARRAPCCSSTPTSSLRSSRGRARETLQPLQQEQPRAPQHLCRRVWPTRRRRSGPARGCEAGGGSASPPTRASRSATSLLLPQAAALRRRRLWSSGAARSTRGL